MNKHIIGIILISILVIPGFSLKEVKLPEILNPNSITVDDQQIYIIQGVNVFIYSLEDFKLIKKFGRAGEGPREFKKVPVPWIPSISLYFTRDNLLINSVGKISHYSKKGDFIKEIPATGSGPISRFIPLENKFIVMEYTRENNLNVIAASVLDENLKNKKRFCTVKFPQQGGKKRNPILMAKMATYLDRFAYKGKFVIPVNENGTIKIFGRNGKELKSFTPEYTKVDITAESAKKLDDFFCNDIRYKRPYLNDKGRNLITFGDSLPLFNYYRLGDDKIYIISNYKRGGKYETFIYNMKGELLKKMYIPLVNQDIFDVYPFCIKNNKVYQLVWDEEEEEIRLTITEI